MEVKTARDFPKAVAAIEVTDGDDRVTGYCLGIRPRRSDSYFFAREDVESLESFAQRAEVHAGEPYGGDVHLIVRQFVSAKEGKSASTNEVGPT